MSSEVIRAEGIGKRYRLGDVHRHHATLRDEIARLVRRRPGARGTQRDDPSFWALRDVSFGVRRGEVLGVIGANGAGKSTLLKILSRITHPTTGRVTVQGRVGTLLEVGTGFHPELSGRENIYLNGAILGMKRRDIDKRLDEIVAFAEVERFLDTPVKRYSSGMYVRLAFAVAAHLEPEILIVDEVLAVGDLEFQKKCLGKMNEIHQASGRTIVFVSHNLSMVSQICTHGILLNRGAIVCDGAVDDVIHRYQRVHGGDDSHRVDILSPVMGHGPRRMGQICSIEMTRPDGDATMIYRLGDGMRIRVVVRYHTPVTAPIVGAVISTALGQRVHKLISSWEGFHHSVDRAIYQYDVTIPCLLMAPGSYTVGVFLRRVESEPVDHFVDAALRFQVVGQDFNGNGAMLDRMARAGEVYAPSDWRVVQVQSHAGLFEHMPNPTAAGYAQP